MCQPVVHARQLWKVIYGSPASARLGDWLWETASAEQLLEVVQRKWRGGYVIRAIMRPDGTIYLDEAHIIRAFAKASASGIPPDLGLKAIN